MLRRLLLIFLPPLTATSSFASESNWSCQQDKSNNQWVCLSDQINSTPTVSTTVTEKQSVVSASTNNPITETLETAIAPTHTPIEPAEQNINHSQPLQAVPVQQVNSTIAPNLPISQLAHANTEPRSDLIEKLNFGLLEPAFDHQQEQIFDHLSKQFKSDPWANCSVQLSKKPAPTDNQAIRNKTPLDLKANYSEILDNEIGNYSGKVEMNRADQHVHADNANYDSVSETLDLQGNIVYSEDDFALHSDSATIKLATDQAKLRNTLFISALTPLRGSAKAMYRDDKYLSRYKNVTYTSCRPGNNDWAIHASELKINKENGRGRAKNAWMEFKGLPVFYSPYLGFPVDNRRSSGFLAPTFGNTKTSGYIVTTPYYWNIAPNYDATLETIYFSDRGLLLGANFRYLTSQSSGKATVEYMPDDRKFDGNRHHLMLKDYTQITEHLSANLDLNTVSDKNYFAELSNALSFPNFSFLKSQGGINYLRDGVNFTAKAESYQTIDSSLTGSQIPYRRLPQINLKLNHSFNFNNAIPMDADIETETVNFQHDTLVNGDRVNLKPSLSFPLHNGSSYLTPKLSVQHTEYYLSHQQVGLPLDLSRTVPITSINSGTYLERNLNIANKSYIHTLEPRLFYLYIPKVNQSQIPLFDTSIYDFWYNSLFRENRFSGSDRVQDANQVSVALTSRLLDPVNGRERLKLNLGEIFYFQNRDVTLNLANSPIETSRSSPIVAELSSQMTQHFSVESGIQWDPHSNRIVRGKAMLHYANEANEIINLGYLFRQDPLVPNQINDITQSDASFRWPIYDTWYAVGRWQYSWLYNRTQDGFLGLEKENCCWRFRVIGRSYINTINQVTNPLSQVIESGTQTGIFFQIEFKGLSAFGTQLDNFFATSIYGYREPAK